MVASGWLSRPDLYTETEISCRGSGGSRSRGARAGEGYFSPDGTRDGLPERARARTTPSTRSTMLDLMTGDVAAYLARARQDDLRVHPARALATSCSAPPTTTRESKKLQKASSTSAHPARSGATAWDYDPEMEIYVHDEAETGELERLTDAARLRRRRRATRPTGSGSFSRPCATRTTVSCPTRSRQPARGRPVLFRRDLHHARRRLRCRPA